jgi:hypothetical protein
MQGTPTYASLDVHNCCQPMRKDDVESMGLVLLSLFQGIVVHVFICILIHIYVQWLLIWLTYTYVYIYVCTYTYIYICIYEGGNLPWSDATFD